MNPEWRMHAVEKQMREEWDSWRWLIKEDLERIDRRLQLCYQAMAIFGANREMREQYVLGKLAEMMRKIGEGA